MRDNKRDIKIIKALDKIKPSEDVMERIPYLVGGYSIYSGVDGKLFPIPMGIFQLWKRTFVAVFE